MSKTPKKVLVIGGGPAGLVAAHTLCSQSQDKEEFKVTIFEASSYVGGLSRTHNYKGNRMDIGGHRFFSKSDIVMDWWQSILPVEQSHEEEVEISYQGKKRLIHTSTDYQPKNQDRVMLIRNRLSRIYYLRNFFSYPIKLSIDTLKKLGMMNLIRIGFSYIYIRIFPRKQESTLEDFLINRFGMALYSMFFKDYTEKVWGVPCGDISAEWGAQRIKGLSITEAIKHALRSKKSVKNSEDIKQKNTETSLIEKFLYPRLGPGMMWETVSEQIQEMGGEIVYETEVVGFELNESKISTVRVSHNGQIKDYQADYVISSMPIKNLVNGIKPRVPSHILKIANGLVYRDFITVGLLINQFKGALDLKDNWVYIQEKDVKIGRLQIFNNWSLDLVSNANNIWLGLEYFCQEGDELWKLNSQEMLSFAIQEMVKLDLIIEEDVLDGTVLKVPKTYPAYFGSYGEFDVLRAYLDRLENLFLIGRNGMHRYNNQDHSMLTGMMAAEQILSGNVDKEMIWSINTEMEYHEEK